MTQFNPYIKTLFETQQPGDIVFIFRKSWNPKAKAYVYFYTFEKNGQKWYYIGYHKIGIDKDKFYDFSSEVEEMRDLYSDHTCKKTCEVIAWGTEAQMKQFESEELDKVKHRWWNNGKGDYFNQRNQYLTPNQISNIDYDLIRDINHELEILKEKRVHQYGQLKILNANMIVPDVPARELSSIDNIQTREIEIHPDLIKELKVVIRSQINDQRDIAEDAKCVVTLVDRDFTWNGTTEHYDRVLICGKHTADAFGGNSKDKWHTYATLDEIRIPKEVNINWNDTEVWKISNGDNKKNNSERPISEDDIIREYKEMVHRNLEWETDVEKKRVERDLRKTTAWQNIKNAMESWEHDNKRLSKGQGPRIAYGETKNKKPIQEKLDKLNGWNRDELIKKVIDDDYVIDVWNVGPYTTEIINPYVQLQGSINKKIYKIYSNKSDIQKKKLAKKFWANIELIKYWLYYSTPASKRKFNKEHSHKIDLFLLGDTIFKHDYDYEILDEYKQTLT